mmetsp:Transcript_33340/g.98327  ORF Transcript_33340/g.98327 Transcript_33340/m.98327 type:complete len:557 (-) Transcript_33340:586-2256(-)
MKIQSGTIAAFLTAALAVSASGVDGATSDVVSGSTSRLPMGLSEVITDLEAEGAGRIATCAFMSSRSVPRGRRSALFRSLFGVTGDGEEDHQVEDGSTTAFGKRMGEDGAGTANGDDDEESGVGVVVANTCGRRSVAEVAASVQACGGSVVYVADPNDLDRGEGLFDVLAPAVERYLASCADDGEGELGSLGQAERKSALLVVLEGGSAAEMAAARSKFEAAAAVMLSSIVQPEGKRCKALQEVFDRVEYVPSTVAVHELLCEMGGSGTDPATAACAVSSAVTDLEKSGMAASCGLAKPVDLAAARRLGDASHNALKFVMSTVEQATTAEDGSSAQLVPDFGALCDAAVKRAMEDFDAQAGSLTKKSAVAKRIRRDLLEEVYAELADLYDIQLKELRSATFGSFRKGLSQLRLGPNLPDEMNRVVTESVAAFVSQAKKLRAHGRGVSLSWSASDAAASDFRRELKEFSTDRLNKARVEGKFRPAPRKGVAIGLHWLLPKPFGNDYRQDPWNVHAKDNLVYTPPDKITDVSKADVKTGDWRKSVVPNPTGSEMIYLQ